MRWGIGRRLRSTFGLGSSRMTIRSQMAWYWRWLTNLLAMAAVATVVWWLVQNSYRITGFNPAEARSRISALTEENQKLQQELEGVRASLVDRERLLQVDRAAQQELARTVAQLQEENASLKEDLGFLRRVMSSGATPEGVSLSDLRVEREGAANQYRYRMLLTQGGQRKQDFRGRVQVVARVLQDGAMAALTFPDPDPGDSGAFEFRFYHKVDGRFAIPEGATLRNVEVRVLAVPGGQVKLSRTLNMS